MKGFLFKHTVLVFILCFTTSATFSKSVNISESMLHCKRFEPKQKKETLVRFNRGCMQCHHAEPVASSGSLSKAQGNNHCQDNLLIDLHDVIKGEAR